MPKGPQGQKRKADVIGNAVHFMRIATGEISESSDKSAKSKAGSIGGKIGGATRAANLSPKQRKESASKAAKARWGKS
jgi:hypothetical protein